MTCARHVQSVFKESNTQLRAEMEDKRTKLDKTEAKLKEMEAQLLPLQHANARLESKVKVLESDAKQLKEELQRWKQRATELQDKFGGAGVDPVEYEKVRGLLEKTKSLLASNTSDAAKARDLAMKETLSLRTQLKSAVDASKAPSAPATVAAPLPCANCKTLSTQVCWTLLCCPGRCSTGWSVWPMHSVCLCIVCVFA